MAAACVLPTGEQKAAQEPVGQGTGSSSTTSAVISCHFIIHAVVLTSWFPEWHDYMKLGGFFSVLYNFLFSSYGCTEKLEGISYLIEGFRTQT